MHTLFASLVLQTSSCGRQRYAADDQAWDAKILVPDCQSVRCEVNLGRSDSARKSNYLGTKSAKGAVPLSAKHSSPRLGGAGTFGLDLGFDRRALLLQSPTTHINPMPLHHFPTPPLCFLPSCSHISRSTPNTNIFRCVSPRYTGQATLTPSVAAVWWPLPAALPRAAVASRALLAL